MNEHVLKRDTLSEFFIGQVLGIVAIQLDTSHNHAGDPEENNIEASHQHGCRIPEIELLLLLLSGLRPTEIRHWPQIRRGPGVEHVVFLLPVFRIRWAFDRHMHMRRIIKIELRAICPLFIPDRNAVAPPELAADAPVLNAVEPVQVSLLPTIRVKFDRTIFDRTLGLFDLRVFKEPLL